MLSHPPKIFCLSSSTFSVLTRFFGSWLRWSSNVDSGHELKLVWKVFEDGLRHWWTALALDLIPSCLGWSAERHLKDDEIYMLFSHTWKIMWDILNNYLYKLPITTFPFTDWIGSTTTATARSESASKDCCVLISTPDNQQPKKKKDERVM